MSTTGNSAPDDRPVRVVIAPDKFRGSLTATEAAEAMAAGVRDAFAPVEVLVDLVPIADGGEGTLEALLVSGATAVPVRVTGPLGDPVEAAIAVRGDTAYVESAQACGLTLVPRPGPGTATRASTLGVGELIRAAVGTGARTVVVGLGGSATTDGGAGMASALGWVPVDADGRPVPPGGRALAAVAGLTRPAAADRSGLDGVRVLAACDVTAPLVGPAGAAAVFGPQKGADPAAVAVLDDALRTWARVLAGVFGRDVSDVPGAGAAGGLAAGLLAVCDAELVSGADLLLDLVGLPTAVATADLVLTGEGSLDRQTVTGKGPKAVADLARAAGVPVVAVAGRADLHDPDVCAAFDLVGDLVSAFPGRNTMHHTATLLRQRTRDLVRGLVPAGR
ncbi:glycerate kinase [Nakamurella sp. YIM 132084]|uniref:Glycerate kinase n=1 Tax=Nakamurella leprariae TaxID=2803911 RepID=A0A938YEM2_9ACTN|nr:glycerate kinase [Nakamurella leprariae]